MVGWSPRKSGRKEWVVQSRQEVVEGQTVGVPEVVVEPVVGPSTGEGEVETETPGETSSLTPGPFLVVTTPVETFGVGDVGPPTVRPEVVTHTVVDGFTETTVPVVVQTSVVT